MSGLANIRKKTCLGHVRAILQKTNDIYALYFVHCGHRALRSILPRFSVFRTNPSFTPAFEKQPPPFPSRSTVSFLFFTSFSLSSSLLLLLMMMMIMIDHDNDEILYLVQVTKYISVASCKFCLIQKKSYNRNQLV